MLDALNELIADLLPIWLADLLRVVTMVVGPVMLGLFIATARQVRNTRQFGMYALVCFGFNGIARSFDGFGGEATYSTLLNFAGVVLGSIFLFRTYRLHGDPEIRPRPE